MSKQNLHLFHPLQYMAQSSGGIPTMKGLCCSWGNAFHQVFLVSLDLELSFVFSSGKFSLDLDLSTTLIISSLNFPSPFPRNKINHLECGSPFSSSLQKCICDIFIFIPCSPSWVLRCFYLSYFCLYALPMISLELSLHRSALPQHS